MREFARAVIVVVLSIGVRAVCVRLIKNGVERWKSDDWRRLFEAALKSVVQFYTCVVVHPVSIYMLFFSSVLCFHGASPTAWNLTMLCVCVCVWRPAVWCVVRVYVYVVAGGQGHTQLKIHDDRKNKEKLRKWKKNEEKLKKIKNEEKRWKLKITKFLFQPVRTKRRTVYMFWSRRIVGSAV